MPGLQPYTFRETIVDSVTEQKHIPQASDFMCPSFHDSPQPCRSCFGQLGIHLVAFSLHLIQVAVFLPFISIQTMKRQHERRRGFEFVCLQFLAASHIRVNKREKHRETQSRPRDKLCLLQANRTSVFRVLSIRQLRCWRRFFSEL